MTSVVPLIGVTGEVSEQLGFKQIASVVSDSYRLSIERAGGAAVLVLPSESEARLEAIVERLDGIVFSGGADLPPQEYLETEGAFTAPMHRLRHATDFTLLRLVRKHRLPFVATCLGCQELNVAMGGTLWQDLPTQRPDSEVRHDILIHPYATEHPVRIVPGTRLHAIAGRDEITVSSAHHQGLRVMGSGLRPAAWAPDDLLEAVEIDDPAHFGIAVQWHPEKMGAVGNGVSHRLFRALIDAAAARNAARGASPAPALC